MPALRIERPWDGATHSPYLKYAVLSLRHPSEVPNSNDPQSTGWRAGDRERPRSYENSEPHSEDTRPERTAVGGGVHKGDLLRGRTRVRLMRTPVRAPAPCRMAWNSALLGASDAGNLVILRVCPCERRVRRYRSHEEARSPGAQTDRLEPL